ncbi:MAG: topoisomerase C-terminal repeat-containing protein [Prevotellaceae bacterium]|jgi:DNA topoisomerase-3|nr:topoisomerase C-terminal repeat-containing protein [Prevotellaceae bacterium]
MKVVVAEKPSMGRDIARVLGATTRQEGYMEGNGYQVTWAIGHLVEIYDPTGEGRWRDTPLPVYGDFALRPKEGAEKQLSIIGKLLKSAEEVINAGDAGREGELIQRYIYRYLGCAKPVRRLWISSLTDAAIREGFARLKPGGDYDRLYDAARARNEADSRVGINATRALSLAVNNGEVFSLGRVQTPTLAMVCRRYLEHKNFAPRPFWRLLVKTAKEGVSFLVKPRESYTDRARAEEDLRRLTGEETLRVAQVERRERQEKPPLLYDLTGLQKAANRRYGMTADRTLQAAQSLYEGKYLSYPRTGSSYIPEDVFAGIPKLIAQCRGIAPADINSGYYEGSPTLSRGCVNDGKVTDHHALLPTGVAPENLKEEEARIYRMVLARMLEAFHQPCVKEVTTVRVQAGGMELQATGTHLRVAGWREVLGGEAKSPDAEGAEEEAESEEVEASLPELREGDTLPNLGATLKEDKTKPLPLLTDATLLAYMETAGREVEDEEAREAMKEGGLGTPATRDSIIKNIIDRGYVAREKKKLVPTEKGLATYETVKDRTVASPALTGEWEKRLSRIQQGTLSVESFLAEVKSFTEKITRELLEVCVTVKSRREAESEKTPLCPKCGQQRLRLFQKTEKSAGGLGCSKECGFVLWRAVAGKPLTDGQLVALATKKITPEIGGFTSKAGKKFSARLKLDAELKVAFDFAPSKAKAKR